MSTNIKKARKSKTKQTREIDSVLSANYPLKLEQFLFPEGRPAHYPPFKKSPELLTIFHLLFSLGYNTEVAAWDGFEIAAASASDLEQRMRLIIGAETRSIEVYRCHTNFRIVGLDFAPMAELPIYQTPEKARQIYCGDLLLVRRDEKILKQRGTVELQILTNGLYGSDNDDWRIFVGTALDITQIAKYSTKERMVEYGRQQSKGLKTVRFNYRRGART